MNTNPTRFHLIALGTMHSLPSPVPRKGQRNYKPEFFDFLRKQREAEDGVSETLHWLRQVRTLRFSQLSQLKSQCVRRERRVAAAGPRATSHSSSPRC